MANERATIKIDVDADTRELDKVTRKILGVAAASKAADDDVDNLGKTFNKTGRDIDATNKKLDTTNKKFKSTSKAADGLSKVLKTAFKFAMIGSAIETAGLALALSSVNGLFATGRFLVKGYQVAMSGLAKGAAVAGAALATVAAAQRQFIAAQATGRYGGSFAAASAGLRTMQSDARLASTGMKALNSAFAAASKNARVTGATTGAIAGLLDFAYVAGDVEKGTAALASFVSLLQKGEAVGGSKVLAAATEIGPEFEKQYKDIIKGGKVTSQELFKMFSSGDFAKQAGVSGSAAAVQGSLVGQFKGFITTMQVMFADLGAKFIVPFQEAFAEVERILRRTVIAIGPIIAEYTTGTLIDKLVNGIDKLSKFLVTLMREYVPMVTGFFAKLADFWNRIQDGFSAFSRYLNKFKEGSRIINRFFGGILRAIGRGLKGNFEEFSQQVVDNQDNLLTWGERIEGFIDSIFKLFRSIRNAFFEALPIFERFLGIITSIVNAISGLVNVLSGLGPLGGLVGYLGPILGMGMLTKGGRRTLRSIRRGVSRGFNYLANNPGQAMLGGGFLLNAATNQMGTGGEFIGDVLSGALVGGGVANLASRGLSNLATTGYMAGQGALEAGGRFANIGGSMASRAGALQAGGMGSLMAQGAILVGGAVATHEGSKIASDLAYRATGGNRAASIGAGAATGFGTGFATAAALSSFTGPFSLGFALVGGLIGGIVGGINGYLQDSKYKKKAKEAATTFVDGYTDIMGDALAQNNIEAFRQMQQDFEKYRDMVADAQVKSGTARDKADELYAMALEDELMPIYNMMEARLTDLGKISGKSEEEIIGLANAAEINLGNGMLSLKDILEATGIATVRFGQDFKNALADVYAEAVSGFRSTLDVLNAPNIMNENAQALREVILSGGTVGQEELASFLETQYSQALLISGGDPIEAYKYMSEQFGYMEGGQFIPGKQFNLTQAQLMGLMPTGPLTTQFGGVDFGAALIAAGLPDFMKPFQEQMQAGAADLVAQNVYGQLASFGLTPSTNIAGFTNVLAGLDPTRLMALSTLASDPAFLGGDIAQALANTGFGQGGQFDLARGMSNEVVQQIMTVAQTGQGMQAIDLLKTILGADVYSTLGNITTSAEAGLERVAVAFEEGSPMMTAMNTFNENIQKLVDAVNKNGDTATPRANTLRTLGTHAQFDAMIAGKRSVTSSYRTSRLGSMNSDHANGLAYDLTGQNLGMYGQAIRGAGGFAEFHGNGRGRHLHVVPNPAMGDTAMPMTGRSVFVPTQQSSTNLTVVVNPPPGMDVNAIAREVISQYERAQKSRNERY